MLFPLYVEHVPATVIEGVLHEVPSTRRAFVASEEDKAVSFQYWKKYGMKEDVMAAGYELRPNAINGDVEARHRGETEAFEQLNRLAGMMTGGVDDKRRVAGTLVNACVEDDKPA